MAVWERMRRRHQRGGRAGNYADWRDRNQVFEQMTAISKRAFNLTGGDQPERVSGSRVTPSFFTVLGVKPSHGRAFTEEEGQLGHEQVVLVKQSLWERRFASDPNLIGKQIKVDGKSYTVIGILRRLHLPLNGSEFLETARLRAKNRSSAAIIIWKSWGFSSRALPRRRPRRR